LDHFMQRVYSEYYEKKGRGFSENEFKKELELFLGRNLDEFYAKYINGVEIPNYNDFFSKIGLNVNYSGKTEASVGMFITENNGKTIVRGIVSNSAAEDAGISVNDEIIGCNGMRADKSSLEDYFKGVQEGELIEILFARDQELFSTEIKVTSKEIPRFEMKFNDDKSTHEKFNYWLRAE